MMMEPIACIGAFNYKMKQILCLLAECLLGVIGSTTMDYKIGLCHGLATENSIIQCITDFQGAGPISDDD